MLTRLGKCGVPSQKKNKNDFLPHSTSRRRVQMWYTAVIWATCRWKEKKLSFIPDNHCWEQQPATSRRTPANRSPLTVMMMKSPASCSRDAALPLFSAEDALILQKRYSRCYDANILFKKIVESFSRILNQLLLSSQTCFNITFLKNCLVRLPQTDTNTPVNLLFYHFKNTLKFPWMLISIRFFSVSTFSLQKRDLLHRAGCSEPWCGFAGLMKRMAAVRGWITHRGLQAPGKHKQSPVQPQRWQLLAFYCTSQAEVQNSK